MRSLTQFRSSPKNTQQKGKHGDGIKWLGGLRGFCDLDLCEKFKNLDPYSAFEWSVVEAVHLFLVVFANNCADKQ